MRNIALNILTLMISIGLFLLAYQYGKDFESYQIYFECLANDSCLVDWEVEPLTVILAKTVGSTFGANFLIFVYIYIALGLKIYALKRMDKVFLPFVLYLVAFSVILEGNQIRAAIGVGLVILAIQYYIENKNKLAAITFIASVSFHYSMIICALLVVNRWLLLIGSIVIVVITSMLSVDRILVFYDMFPELAVKIRLISFATYFENQPDATIFNTKTLLAILVSVPLILNWVPGHIKELLINNLILLTATMIGLLVASNLFSRLSDIFLIIAVIFTFGYAQLRPWYIITLMLFLILKFVTTFIFVVA